MVSNKESGTKWTNEQQRAIDTHDKNLLVAAAAGSGKTAVLVERIIKMIVRDENPVDIDKLLVVTFTNAAASEMRERIGNAITDKLDKNPNNKRLQKQLTLLNKANITTMHSFCLDVIRNNFHHIDLDPNFRIGDQTEIILLKQDIVGELFEDKYEGMTLTDGFYKLVETFGGNKDDSKLQDMIEGLYNFSMSGPYPKIWLNKKAEEFNLSSEEELYKSKWMEIIMDGVEEELESMINSLHGLIDILKEEDASPKIIDNLSETISSIYIAIDGYKAGYDEFQRSLQSITFGTLRMGKDLDDSIKSEVKNVRDSVKYKVKEMQKTFSFSLRDSYEAIKDMYPIMEALTDLVIEFMERYRNKKIEKGILDFNDLEHYCLKILNETYDKGIITPSSVAMEFKDKFYEVLVDEYQDSNSVQETIIDLVSRKNSDNPNVFMVGDVKQSIYRFRQAKPELFLEKYNTYEEISDDHSNNSGKILLYKNFRSRKEVLRGVNYIFKKIMSASVGEMEYTDKERLNPGAVFDPVDETNFFVGGDIDVNIIDLAGKSEEEETEVAINDEILDEEELDKIQVEARLVAKKIKDLFKVQDGKHFVVYDKEVKEYRQVKYKDIVILLRATAGWADVFSEELAKEEIPAYADSSSGYFQTIEIRTMMSLLQIIDNPLQDIPMVAVLRSPIFAFTPEDLIDLRVINKNKYFYDALKDIAYGEFNEDVLPKEYVLEDSLIKKAKYVMESLDKWREKSIHMPIDEFIWYLYMSTSYYGYVRAMPNGVQRQANLRILFQRAKQYESTSFKGLFNFINFINKLRSSSGDMGSAKTLGENEDVVRIMSIHKSKGLEFPVVILSACGKQFNQRDIYETILFHEDLGFGPDFIDYEKRYKYPTLAKEAIKKKLRLENLSEEMRVLYVALTRAKEKLILTGTTSNLEKSIDKWGKAVSVASKTVPSNEVFKGKSYLDWISMALMLHNDGSPLVDCFNGYIDRPFDDEESSWKINIYSKSDIIGDNIESDEDTEEDMNIFEEIGTNDYYKNEVEKRLNWEYKFKRAGSIPTNMSVSELKKSALLEEEQSDSNNLIKESPLRKPKFLQEIKGLSPAERGTALHSAMQHLSLDNVSTLNEIKSQIAYFVAKEILTDEEAEAVNPYKILKFFRNPLGERILSCYKESGNKVHREKPFYIEVPSTSIIDELPVEIYENELIRIQGVIDCFLDEDDGIILIDYKTDYVDRENREKVINRYATQIYYYTMALEKITGKKVKEKYLYLFYIDEAIKINN